MSRKRVQNPNSLKGLAPKYEGEIPETPAHHITLWVDDPIKRFTVTFDPKLLAKKIEKFKGKLEVPPQILKQWKH